VLAVAGRPIVENCLAGYNSCIFAYGQTGSGKTYTMSGPSGSVGHLNNEEQGLIPRVFDHLFTRIARMQSRQVSCKCSFLEIYNENITDLLSPSEAHLQIREDAARGPYVENLCEEEVSSVDDVARLLARGQAARRVGETNMNRESSRSHSVFTCTLESRTTDESGITNILRSRLNLVDLAGSERQKSSGAAGERLREASSINKSLSSLGLVIMSLVDVQRGAQRHVPYRDSRLTYLLQDSLGGNSKTIMVANISPASANLAETISTLRFAQRAKSIKNKVRFLAEGVNLFLKF
ncbi:kinesin-domain-containing protein, partial [Coccomyxa subellipsoidea C-169]